MHYRHSEKLGGFFVIVSVFPSTGKTNGITSKIINPTPKDSFIEKFLIFLFSRLFEKNSFDNIDNPNEDRIIIDIDANTSNLTNAELT